MIPVGIDIIADALPRCSTNHLFKIDLEIRIKHSGPKSLINDKRITSSGTTLVTKRINTRTNMYNGVTTAKTFRVPHLSMKRDTTTMSAAEKKLANIHTPLTEFLDVPKSSINESMYSFTPNV